MERRYSPRKMQRMVRGYKGLRQYFPMGETELRKRVNAGLFPQPIRLGPRSLAWFESDILAVQERLAERRNK